MNLHAEKNVVKLSYISTTKWGCNLIDSYALYTYSEQKMPTRS
jgi:hypothetical protein